MRQGRGLTGKRSYWWWALAVLFGLPALFFIVAYAIGSWRLQYKPGSWVRVNLPKEYAGCPDLRFNLPGAPPTRAAGPLYIVDLPADGRWHTSTNLNWGETLTFAYYAQAADGGWKHVEPNRLGGATQSYPDGSVAPLPACFALPYQWARE